MTANNAGERLTDPPDLTSPHALPSTQPDRPKVDLSVAQIVGGALAAVTAAALGSRLGLAGTLVGAAVASVVAGVASSVYTTSLRRTQEKVRTAWTGRARTGLPWTRMLGGVVTVFALAIVALTGFELVSGSAVSGGHGTTIEQASRAHELKGSPGRKAAASPSEARSSGSSLDAARDASHDDATPSSKPTRTTTEPAQTQAPAPSASKVPTGPAASPVRSADSGRHQQSTQSVPSAPSDGSTGGR